MSDDLLCYTVSENPFHFRTAHNDETASKQMASAMAKINIPHTLNLFFMRKVKHKKSGNGFCLSFCLVIGWINATTIYDDISIHIPLFFHDLPDICQGVSSKGHIPESKIILFPLQEGILTNKKLNIILLK
jgi:hypothetical protein